MSIVLAAVLDPDRYRRWPTTRSHRQQSTNPSSAALTTEIRNIIYEHGGKQPAECSL